MVYRGPRLGASSGITYSSLSGCAVCLRSIVELFGSLALPGFGPLSAHQKTASQARQRSTKAAPLQARTAPRQRLGGAVEQNSRAFSEDEDDYDRADAPSIAP